MNALFIGIGTTASCWYRCALPARALGADWIGVSGEPTALTIRTGQCARDIGGIDDLATYDVVVLQQPRGNAWLNAIAALRRRGTRVLCEVDADLDDDALALALRAGDGIICATEQLAARYAPLNAEIWVCANGIDLGRYALSRTPHDTVRIGWAGGTEHRAALEPWLPELEHVLAARPETCVVSIGAEDLASILAERFGPRRCIGLPWGPIETNPAAMSCFDIALAPAAATPAFRGTSDLRWLEASALGVPTVADPALHPAIEHGVSGLHAATPAEARAAIMALVDDESLRERIGAAARAHVREHRCIEAVAPQWASALAGVRVAAAAA
ncbi:MAG TPA: glycosyltransferase [Solirubrobacteraceae bacterium]|nr:glycosyltransferase [Solirubrobacteraceae bacterium]